MIISGQDVYTEQPKEVTIQSEDVRAALQAPIEEMVLHIKDTFKKTNPDLASDIIQNGILLTGGGPVGGMAFVLVLVTFLASRLFMALNNDTLFMPVAIMLACIMLVEVMYGLIVVVCGADVPLGEAFLYRTLPCMLYDCVIGLLLYPIAARVMVDRPRVQPGTPVLR